ncbi:hypothetical protein C5167_023234 [Papaver somniferum]|uniref:Uncharacterized protein n=1 Tax=Papaver somniferum TaxID=3469 RepID=A0A4Y7JNU4_PAPSO|nr:hypothetical protein C5167_023234 [Papaver somniferum]
MQNFAKTLTTKPSNFCNFKSKNSHLSIAKTKSTENLTKTKPEELIYLKVVFHLLQIKQTSDLQDS